MASSENLASIDPWAFRSTFNDCWLSEVFARDTETLTKALQKSLEPATPFSPDFFRPEPVQTPTPTVSGLSGSDPDTPSSVAGAANAAAAAVTTKRHRSAIPPKASKRKSRATKRSQTTFITADPANFRQMVQQVTGVRLGGAVAQFGSAVTAPILKPEPQRACSGRFPVAGATCLPTLDTSALVLDHHQKNNQQTHQPPVGSTTAGMESLVGGAGVSAPAMVASFGGGAGGGGGAGLDFDGFPSFPTLESWKVM